MQSQPTHLLALFVALAAFPACASSAVDEALPEVEPAPAAVQGPTASPQAVVAHLRDAEESGDYGAMLDVMAPGDRTSFVWSAWFGAAYNAIGGEGGAVAGYEAINARYELDPEWLNRTSGEPIGRDGLARLADEAFREVDLAALLTDLTSLAVGDGTFFGEPNPHERLEVDGDRATALVGGSELLLRRLPDGRWLWFPHDE